MERRNFLKGLFGGVTAAGLVVMAKPEEIKAFASPLKRDAPVMIAAPQPVKHVSRTLNIAPGQMLFDSAGKPVAVVQSLDLTRGVVDTTTFGSNSTYLQGIPSLTLTAVVYGPATINV